MEERTLYQRTCSTNDTNTLQQHRNDTLSQEEPDILTGDQDEDYNEIVADETSLSMLLSDVLADIGVTKEIVETRRNTWLEIESMNTLHWRLQGEDFTWFHFGSQSEGTTTFGLNSDVDMMHCDLDTHIILDIDEWEQDEDNVLVYKHNTSPGYCCLLPMLSTEPRPVSEVDDDDYQVTGEDGRVFLKHSVLRGNINILPEGEYHGPAWSYKSLERQRDEDYVDAYYCKHFPTEASEWNTRTENKPWPSTDVKRQVLDSGCFIVAVGHKESKNGEIEFRMSTTKGERILMFDLNITQIRCLIIMKMLMKILVNNKYKDAMKSFYCKTALLYVTEENGKDIFREDTLIGCLKKCLTWLHTCVKLGRTPHYMTYNLDIFEGRLDADLRGSVGNIIESMIDDPIHAILKIEIDDVGTRFFNKINNLVDDKFETRESICASIGNFLSVAYILWGHLTISDLMDDICKVDTSIIIERVENLISQCEREFETGDVYIRTAVERVRPMLKSKLGGLLASQSIKNGQKVSDIAIQYLRQGCHSDAASGRLKLATVLFCKGDTEGTREVLGEIEQIYAQNGVESACVCSGIPEYKPKHVFGKAALDYIRSKTMYQHYTHCLLFKENDRFCIPDEWQSAIFRPSERANTDAADGEQDLAEYVMLDPKPYFHFMEYFIRTNKCIARKSALNKLQECVGHEHLFHKETALNLLGFCLDMEGRAEEALARYDESWFIQANCKGSTCTSLIVYD